MREAEAIAKLDSIIAEVRSLRSYVEQLERKLDPAPIPGGAGDGKHNESTPMRYIYTVPQAAEWLGISSNMAATLIQGDSLPSLTYGDSGNPPRRITLSALMRYIRDREEVDRAGRPALD